MPSTITTTTMGLKPLRILYQNDVHLSWDNLSHSVTAFNQLSQDGYLKGRDVLRLNAGDYMTGGSKKDFGLVLKLINMMKFHAMALGNHELSMGLSHFVTGIKQLAHFPTLVSNLALKPGQAAEGFYQQLKSTGQLQEQPMIVEGQHGPYGLIGLTRCDNKFPYSAELQNMGFKTASFEQSLGKVKEQVKWLEEKGVQQIVLLSHLGYENDKALAQKVDGIDVIVGGDSHTVLNGTVPGRNWLFSPSGKPVLVLQSGHNAQYVGVADLNFNPQGDIVSVSNRLIPSQEFPKDPVAHAVVESTLPPDRFITTMMLPFERPGLKSYLSNTSLPEFVADQVRDLTGADIGLIRRPEVRSTIPAGPLFYRQLENVMPYESQLMTLRLTGKEIMSAMSDYLKQAKKSAQGFLVPSGLRYDLNLSTRQITNPYVYDLATKTWVPLSSDKTYRVGMTDFVLKNAFEAPGFRKAEAIERRQPITLRDAFILGVQRVSGPQAQFMPPASDGRINITP